jgi:DNA-binding PadR family transcriptional regulator
MFYGFSGHGCSRQASRFRGFRKWGPFEFSWEGGPDGAQGRSRRRMFDGGELRLVLLKLIADAPRHGYDLIREIESLTHGAYAPSPGVVYPTLTLLDDMGLIVEQRGKGARKSFAVTDDGTAHLAERSEEVEALMARLSALGEERSKPDAAAVRRAMGNLRSVLMHRYARGGLDPEAIDDIVGWIDELARKIEKG